jgi:hypothetical protein
VLLAVVATVLVAFPVRDLVARRELRWLERQWTESQADDGARIAADQHLKSYLPVTDGGPVNAALAALYREEGQRFIALRDRVHRSRLVDDSLSALRSQLGAALNHRATLLSAVAAWYEHPTAGSPPDSADNQTSADNILVERARGSARSHFGEYHTVPVATAAPYRGATTELVHLAHWLDQPLGVILLAVAGGQQVVRLDVDGSRESRLPGISVDGNLVPRQGYLAFSSGGRVWAVAPDGSGPPRLLARGSSPFAAAEANAVWVSDPTTLAVTEVDGSGHVLRGPLTVPGGAVDATASALVVLPPDQSAIEVWDLATGQVRCRLGGRTPASFGVPYELAAQGNFLAWVDTSNRVHMTDTRTCADRPGMAPKGGTPLQSGPPVTAAFSPDGRRFAIAGSDQDRPGEDVYFLQSIDVASAQVTTVPVRTGFPITAIAWSADSTRLFWLAGGPGRVAPAVSTWRVGDTAVRPFRLFDPGLGPPLLVVP